MQRWIDIVLARFGQAAGWVIGFCLVLSAILVGMGLVLMAAAFLVWVYTWQVGQ